MGFCCCGNAVDNDIIGKNGGPGFNDLSDNGLSRVRPPQLVREEKSVMVTLNVYSLIESNKRLTRVGMGIFHTGVVIYGIEWGYGEAVDSPNASGLFCVHPGQAAGKLYRTLRIGHTTKSPTQVDTILHRLENEWRSSDYHILHNNCNHFAQALCDMLSTTEKLMVPSWCNRAARVSDKVVPRRLATKVQRLFDDAPPRAVVPSANGNISEVPQSVIPREWYLHPRIAQPTRYHQFIRAPPLHSTENDVPPPGFTAEEAADLPLPAAAPPTSLNTSAMMMMDEAPFGFDSGVGSSSLTGDEGYFESSGAASTTVAASRPPREVQPLSSVEVQEVVPPGSTPMSSKRRTSRPGKLTPLEVPLSATAATKPRPVGAAYHVDAASSWMYDETVAVPPLTASECSPSPRSRVIAAVATAEVLERVESDALPPTPRALSPSSSENSEAAVEAEGTGRVASQSGKRGSSAAVEVRSVATSDHGDENVAAATAVTGHEISGLHNEGSEETKQPVPTATDTSLNKEDPVTDSDEQQPNAVDARHEDDDDEVELECFKEFPLHGTPLDKAPTPPLSPTSKEENGGGEQQEIEVVENSGAVAMYSDIPTADINEDENADVGNINTLNNNNNNNNNSAKKKTVVDVFHKIVHRGKRSSKHRYEELGAGDGDGEEEEVVVEDVLSARKTSHCSSSSVGTNHNLHDDAKDTLGHASALALPSRGAEENEVEESITNKSANSNVTDVPVTTDDGVEEEPPMQRALPLPTAPSSTPRAHPLSSTRSPRHGSLSEILHSPHSSPSLTTTTTAAAAAVVSSTPQQLGGAQMRRVSSPRLDGVTLQLVGSDETNAEGDE